MSAYHENPKKAQQDWSGCAGLRMFVQRTVSVENIKNTQGSYLHQITLLSHI